MKYAMMICLLALTACGHKTALVRPTDIPEYERQRREKIEKYAPYDPENPNNELNQQTK